MRMSAFVRGAGLAILFAVVIFVGAAASTSECAAADTKDITVDCGAGHASIANQLAEKMNNRPYSIYYDKSYYSFSTYASTSTTSETDVIVTCSDDSIPANVMRTAISQGLMSVAKITGDFNNIRGYIKDNGELLWNSRVGFAPSSWYENYGGLEAYQHHINETYASLTVYDLNGKIYLLWAKPYDQTVELTIDTPLCGSTDAPSVTCDALVFTNYYISSDIVKPIWFESKPKGPALSNSDSVIYAYKGALKGGATYFACAEFEAPWGYYFPVGFSKATCNGQPAECLDATTGDEYNNVYIGGYVTAKHVWSDWKTTKKSTALNAGLQERVCGQNVHVQKRILPATGVSGTLLAQMKSKDKTNLALSWTKVKGAEGYDIFFAKCNTKESTTKLKRIKTIKGNKTFAWTKTGLKKGVAYKAQIKAFAYKDGKKQYVKSSPNVHVFTSGGSSKYTNPKSVSVNKTSVTLKKGGSFKIKGKVNKLSSKKKLIPKGHGPTLRYKSSNTAVATVSSTGTIKAKTAGTCKVYVLAINGVRKGISVTVK